MTTSRRRSSVAWTSTTSRPRRWSTSTPTLGLLTTIQALGKVDEITERAIKALEAAKS